MPLASKLGLGLPSNRTKKSESNGDEPSGSGCWSSHRTPDKMTCIKKKRSGFCVLQIATALHYRLFLLFIYLWLLSLLENYHWKVLRKDFRAEYQKENVKSIHFHQLWIRNWNTAKRWDASKRCFLTHLNPDKTLSIQAHQTSHKCHQCLGTNSKPNPQHNHRTHPKVPKIVERHAGEREQDCISRVETEGLTAPRWDGTIFSYV